MVCVYICIYAIFISNIYLYIYTVSKIKDLYLIFYGDFFENFLIVFHMREMFITILPLLEDCKDLFQRDWKKKSSQSLNTGFSCFIKRSNGNLIGWLSWTIVPKRKCKKPEIRWEGKYQQRLNHFMDTVIFCVVWNKHCYTR